MAAKTGARSARPQKTFKLYELVDGVHLKYLVDHEGPTGPVAHKRAVEEGKVPASTTVVTLSPRNLTAGSFEETAPARPTLAYKKVGAPKRAAKAASAPSASKPKPAAPKATGTKAGGAKAKAAGTKAKSSTKSTTKASTKAPAAPKPTPPAAPPAPPAAPAPPAGQNPFAE